MKPTIEEIKQSNSELAEERAMLSGRLASIEGVINSESTDAEKIALLKTAYIEWNAPKVAIEVPADGQERTTTLD